MNFLKKLNAWVNAGFNWVLRSSADPEEASLTVKFALTGLVPYILNAVLFGCNFHVACVPVTSNGLATAVQDTANVVFYLLTIVSYVGALYGFLRKIYLTIRGENFAIKN